MLLLCLWRIEQRKTRGKYFGGFVCVDYDCFGMLVYSFYSFFLASFVAIVKLIGLQ